jgi:peptidoglycan biosynthesis protein MviN/MurJ (putative lipid II flippase)
MNYATTLIFQVVFASRFGASREAAAFVISFGLAVAIGGIFTNTVQSVVVPRLLAPDEDALVRGAVRFLGLLAVLTAIVCGFLAVAAVPLGHALEGPLRVSSETITGLLLVASGVIFFLVLTNILITVSLARGQRMLPAMANAVPSIFATLALIVVADWGVVFVFAAFLGGLVIELVLLAWLFNRPRRLVEGATPHIGPTTAATLAQFALLSTIPPLEGVVASAKVSSGAAQYYYASRGLAVVQQLIIGGAALAFLADWSGLARSRDKQRLSSALVTSSAVVGILLIGAASLAAVAAPTVVAAVYQRGSFTADDTATVARILQLALPGFCAEGLAIIMSRGLLVMQRNRKVILLGLFNFASRITCLAAFGLMFGPKGVAVAYSVSWVAIAGLQAVVLYREGLLDLEMPIVRQGTLVALCTAACAAVLIVNDALPVLVNGAIVAGVFATLLVLVRPIPMRRLQWQALRQ